MPYLPEALDSLLAQTLPADQIIVIDDGSSDDSADCVRNYAQRHPGAGIELIQQKHGGESVARNAGIAAATAAWVAQLDADDWWEPEKLERQLAAAGGAVEAEPCVFVHTGQITHEADGRTTPMDLAATALRVGWCTKQLVEPIAISHSSILVRRETLERIGGYDVALPHAVDIDVYFKLSVLGTFAFVPEYLVHYRRHDRQTSWNYKIDQLRHHHRVIRRFFDQHPRLAKQVGRNFIEAALRQHVEEKLESFWWNRRLHAFRQLLEYADEQGFDGDTLRRWRRRGRLPTWIIRLHDHLRATEHRA